MKDRTVCKSCYNRKRKKNNKNTLIQNESSTSHQQQETENFIMNNNNRTLIVGPSFSSKTRLMMKILSGIPNQDSYIITKSPPEQYSNTKMRIKEIGEEIKPLSGYENAITVFDDILGSSNCKYQD